MKKVKYFVIEFAYKDFMVLFLYVGNSVPRKLLIVELIALNQTHKEEEKDINMPECKL